MSRTVPIAGAGGNVIAAVSVVGTVHEIPVSGFLEIVKLLKQTAAAISRHLRRAKPAKALDLYCGGGGIGLSIADLCGELFGVEQNPAAAQGEAARCRRAAIRLRRARRLPISGAL